MSSCDACISAAEKHSCLEHCQLKGTGYSMGAAFTMLLEPLTFVC